MVAVRHAFEGNEKMVFHQGMECGTVREYSDTLTVFLLKTHKPNNIGRILLIWRKNTMNPVIPGLTRNPAPSQ